MRLNEIHIEGFGRFNDYSRTDIPPGFSVIQGNNEAGKSTLLAFLRAVLFGFQAQRSMKNSYPPLRGGRHGGRIYLTRKNDGQEQRYIVERIAGKGAGTMRVVLPDGSEGGEEAFKQLAGNPSRELFENVFAFSLSELQNLNSSINRDGVRDAIYGAEIGTSPATIRKARQELENKKAELFIPGGRGQQRINGAVQRIEEIRKKLEARKSDPQTHEALQKQLSDCETELSGAEQQYRQARERSARVQLLLQSYDEWHALEAKAQTLARLPVIDAFPENGVARLDAFLIKRGELADQLLSPENEKTELEAKSLGLALDPRVLALDDTISKSALERANYDRDLQKLPALDEECKRLAEDFAGKLRELDAAWDEARLLAFETSIALNDEIRRFKDTFAKGRESVAQLETLLQSAEREHKNALDAEQRKRRALDETAAVNEPLDEQGVHGLIQRLEHFREAMQDRPRLQAELDTDERHAAGELRAIGSDWNESRLHAFDTSLSVREEIRGHQHALAAAARGRDDAQDDHHRKAEEFRATKEACDEAQRVFNAAPEPPLKHAAALRERRHVLRSLRDSVVQRQEARTIESNLVERQLDLEQQLKRREQEALPEMLPAWGVLALAVAGIVLLIVLALAVHWVAGVVALLVFAALAAGYFMLRRESQRARVRATEAQQRDCADLRSRLASVGQRLAECRSRVAALDTQCAGQERDAQLPPDSQIAAVNRAEEETERIQEALRNWEALRTVAEEKSCDAARSGQSAAMAETRLKNSTECESNAQTAWQQWLKNRSLNAAMTPSGVLDLMAPIGTLREKFRGARVLRERIKAIDATIDEFESDAANVFTRCGQMPVARESLCDAVRNLNDALQARKAEKQRHDQAEREWKDAVEFRDAQKTKSDDARTALSARKDEFEEGCRRWRSVLQRAGLRESLTPDGAEEFVKCVANLHDRRTVLEDKRAQRGQTRNAIENYAGRVLKVCVELGAPVPQNGQSGAVVSALATRLQAAKQTDDTQNRTRERIAALTRTLAELEGKRENIDAEIGALLHAGNAESQEAFRASAALFAQRRILKDETLASEIRLRQWAGGDEASKRVRDELAATTLHQLAEEQARLAETIAQAEAAKKSLAEKRARLSLEREQLEKSCDTSELFMSERAERTDIQNAAGEWSALRLAEYLLERAREKYERERRPAVIKEAERFFAQLTGGKYGELDAPMGGTDILVRDRDAKRLKIEELSRGTAEQLYLALRFGFVQEYMKRSEPLPLIFDDILVNFDATRATAAIAAMYELSRDHQILLFTCHADTVERVKRFKSDIPAFSL